MGAEPLKAIREEAEVLEPSMRAAALMRIARVLSASDRDAARAMLDRALAVARSVTGYEGEALLQDSRMYAAAIAPERVNEIPVVGRHGPPGFRSEQLVRIMIEHGHFDGAVQFVLHYEDAATFPFGASNQLIGRLEGERQLAVLRMAIEARRHERAEPSPPGRPHGFIHLFCQRWNLLPMEEARLLAREIVDSALNEPDAAVSMHYDPEQTVEITSRRESTLFEILHVLQKVEPALAESLIAQHTQLANAARRWPNGFESIREESESRRRAIEREGRKGGFFMFGSGDSFPYLHALRQASEDGEFGSAVALVQTKYEEETASGNPNRALKASWASSCMYCTALYRAGQKLGEGATSYLKQIPDSDQRLLARIELAAAVAGLPEFHQTQRGHFPQANQRRRAG